MTRLLFVMLGLAATLGGQDAATALEKGFQGRRVKVLLDMPGDDSGVDVEARGASAAGAVDAEVVRARVAKYGLGLRRGQTATVTLVKLKGDHIEFQMDGGGFTNRQLLGLPGMDSVHWGMSDEERKMRYRISGTRDKERRRRLESDYDRLRARRVRPLREQLEREQRAQHGSRFNVRFGSAREAERVTAEELMVILRGYVEWM